MSLWKFIESKLAETGHDERWLVDECGFSGYMLPRIQAGGVIQNATKQKLAHAFKCSIGDINAAIAERDLPEPRAELLTGEMTMKELASKMKISEETIYMPMTVEAYKQKLKNVILRQVYTFDDTAYGIEDLFGQIGKALMKELMS